MTSHAELPEEAQPKRNRLDNWTTVQLGKHIEANSKWKKCLMDDKQMAQLFFQKHPEKKVSPEQVAYLRKSMGIKPFRERKSSEPMNPVNFQQKVLAELKTIRQMIEQRRLL